MQRYPYGSQQLRHDQRHPGLPLHYRIDSDTFTLNVLGPSFSLGNFHAPFSASDRITDANGMVQFDNQVFRWGNSMFDPPADFLDMDTLWIEMPPRSLWVGAMRSAWCTAHAATLAEFRAKPRPASEVAISERKAADAASAARIMEAAGLPTDGELLPVSGCCPPLPQDRHYEPVAPVYITNDAKGGSLDCFYRAIADAGHMCYGDCGYGGHGSLPHGPFAHGTDGTKVPAPLLRTRVDLSEELFSWAEQYAHTHRIQLPYQQPGFEAASVLPPRASADASTSAGLTDDAPHAELDLSPLESVLQ